MADKPKNQLDKMTPEQKADLATRELNQAKFGAVEIVNRNVANGIHTVDIDQRVFVNWLFLERLLAREYIIANPADDMTIYTNAITAGKAFYTDPEYTGPGWKRTPPAGGASGA